MILLSVFCACVQWKITHVKNKVTIDIPLIENCRAFVHITQGDFINYSTVIAALDNVGTLRRIN